MEKQDMDKERKEALQVTKEIVVKFIEVQRISPANFSEMFPAIYKVVLSSVREIGCGVDGQDDGSGRGTCK